MERKIQDFGGSLIITIPKTLTEIHNLGAGMKLKMRETKEGLLLLYPDEK
jgi:antitoxin component of MazEF toxin-antitoxin module